MTEREYKTRAAHIRHEMNTLAQDMGAVFSTHLIYLRQIFSDVLHADLIPCDGDENREHRRIL